mmetsp:Transcript_8158/g.17860  ORF Transcript_8158/g.17860 Transcript_8158/m.17860 type:complete len:246 (+) Transcript_8158:362-1099(+)|eukprot:5206690-Pleurochrysis_carterae.AAC.2
MSISAILLLTGPGFIAPPSGQRLLPVQPPKHAARSSSARTLSPEAKTREIFFEKGDDSITFGASQKSITVIRPEASGTLHEYVTKNAKRIALSSWPADKVTDLGDGMFVIKVEEFDFLALKVGVSLRARVWLDEKTSTAHFESLGFDISGLESIMSTEGFDVTVKGWMRPSPPQSSLCALTGNVEFTASGKVPGLVRGTPEQALRAATRVISESLIGAASTRFDERVPAAYRKWAADREKSLAGR